MGRYKYLLLTLVTGFVVATIFFSQSGPEGSSVDEQSNAAQVSQLLDLGTAAFGQFSERLATELTRVIEAELLAAEVTAWLENSSFEAVGLASLTPDSSWQVDWAKSQKSKDVPDFAAWISRVPVNAVEDSRLVFQSVSAPKFPSSVLFGVQLRVKSNGVDTTKLGLGVLPAAEVAAVLANVKASGLEFFVVDSTGTALTYTDPRYVGSKMDLHPVVSAFLKAKLGRNIGSYTDLAQRPTIGGFKKLEKSSVGVVANLQTAVPMANNRQQTVTRVLLAAGATIIFALVAFGLNTSDVRVTRFHKDKLNSLQSQIKTLQTESRQYELLAQAHQQWSRSVAGYLRSPIYSMIGELQKLKSKMEAAKELGFIESEVRKLRDFAESLSSKSDGQSPQTFSLTEKTEQVVQRQRDGFLRHGINLYLKDSPQVQVYGSVDELQNALDLLFQYLLKELSRENLGNEVAVSLSQQHGMAQMSIRVPLSDLPEDLSDSMGLQSDRHVSLAVVNGLVRAQSGTVSIERSLNGSTVLMRFPVSTSTVVTAHPPPPAAVEASPKEVSKVEVPPPQQDALLNKRVTDELEKILPPPPEAKPKPEVSVVNELTATMEGSEPQVLIRKPRVRYDT